jgi:hypothetical protein
MTVIHYRPAKLGFSALGCALVAAFLLWTELNADGEADVLWLAAAAVLGYLAFANGRAALGGQPALRFDEQGVQISTLHRSISLRWDEIFDVRIQSFTLRYMWIIPVSRQDFLAFVTKGGPLSSKTYKLAASQLELPAGGVFGLRHTLCGIVGEQAATSALAPAASVPQPSAAAAEGAAFDPDAAIARYLANKQAREEASPASASTQPPRPVFGRRQG